MKLIINNYTTETVEPYIRLAAKAISNVHGRPAQVDVKDGRNGCGRSMCWVHSRRILLALPRREHFVPYERKMLGYFRQHEIALLKPYHVKTWEEELIAHAGHELAHLTRRGHIGRKSRYERFCEKKAADAIELLRSEEGHRFITEYHQSIEEHSQRAQDRMETIAQRKEQAESTEGKLAKLAQAEKRWRTKLKRATTALKKIERRRKRLLSREQ